MAPPELEKFSGLAFDFLLISGAPHNICRMVRDDDEADGRFRLDPGQKVSQRISFLKLDPGYAASAESFMAWTLCHRQNADHGQPVYEQTAGCVLSEIFMMGRGNPAVCDMLRPKHGFLLPSTNPQAVPVLHEWRSDMRKSALRHPIRFPDTAAGAAMQETLLQMLLTDEMPTKKHRDTDGYKPFTGLCETAFRLGRMNPLPLSHTGVARAKAASAR